MNRRLPMSDQEKERLFQSELIKACVPRDQAVKVAQILASEQEDEQLTAEDLQLVKQACLRWLEQRKRWEFILQVSHKEF